MLLLKFKEFTKFKKSLENGKLHGKTIVITGAASGIGKQLAIDVSKYNPILIIIDKDEENLIKVSERCKTEGCDQIILYPCFLQSPENVVPLINLISDDCQQIDFLVLNHAIFQRFTAWNDIKDFLKLKNMFESNFFTHVYLFTMLIPLMNKQGCKVVIISSLVGKVAHPLLSMYCATKFALDGFFTSIKRELKMESAKTRIQFVYLGSIKTPSSLDNIENYRQGRLKRLINYTEVEDATAQLIKKALISENENDLYIPYWTVAITILINRCFPKLENYLTNKIFTY